MKYAARFLLASILLFSSASFALAQSSAGYGGAGQDPCAKSPCPTPASPHFSLDFKLQNPLKVNTIQDAIGLFMRTIVKIAIPFIIVFFIWSGFKFILARGDPAGIKEAKNMFLATLVGTLLILGAWTITNAIVGTINSVASSAN